MISGSSKYRVGLIELLDICVERDCETCPSEVFAAHISGCGETWLESTPKILHSSIVSIEPTFWVVYFC